MPQKSRQSKHKGMFETNSTKKFDKLIQEKTMEEIEKGGEINTYDGTFGGRPLNKIASCMATIACKLFEKDENRGNKMKFEPAQLC